MCQVWNYAAHRTSSPWLKQGLPCGGEGDHPQTFAQDAARGAEVAILHVAADGTDEGAISQRQGAVPAPSPAPGLQRWEDAARADPDTNAYLAKVKVSDEDPAAVALHRDEFHGKQDYTIFPRQQQSD